MSMPYPFYATLIAALSGLLFGYNTGVISGALPLLTKTFHLSVMNQELTVSSIIIGAFIGAISSGRFVDRFGRRRMLLVAAYGFIIGEIITSTALFFSWIIIGRFILGYAIGISSYTTPLFIAERSSTRIRGTLVLINAVTISGGEALAFLCNYWLMPHGAWRIMFAGGIIPAIIFLMGMRYLPETPSWLTLQRHALPPSSRNVIKLFSKEIRPIVWVSLSLGIFQQFFGINTVMYYGPLLFSSVGYGSSSSQLMMTFLMGVVNTVFSVVCFYYVDRIGRRVLLLVGSAVAGLCLFIIAALIPQIAAYPALRLITAVCFVLYIAGYCVSVGSLFWLIIAEIFPLPLRGIGMSLAAAVQWGANFLISMTFLHLIHWLGVSQVLSLYGIICGLCFIYCYYKIPETAKVPLQDVSQRFQAVSKQGAY